MSNKLNGSTTRRYAWHHAGFTEFQHAAGKQARIEQEVRRNDRLPKATPVEPTYTELVAPHDYEQDTTS